MQKGSLRQQKVLMNIKVIHSAFFCILLSLPCNIVYAKKCNDLVVLLDPTKNETVDTKNVAISSHFITALQEQASPILTTSNIVKNFCFWKTEHANTLNKVKAETISNKNSEENITKIKEIIATLSPTEQTTFPLPAFAISLSLIDITDAEWDCFIHKKNNLILLIPQKYSHSKKATNDNFLENLGFNATDLQKVSITPLSGLLKSVNDAENEITADLMSALKSCFAATATDTSWNIYLVGHGSPAKTKKDFLQDKQTIESMYETWQSLINSYRMLNDLKKVNSLVLTSKRNAEEYNLLQSIGSFNDEDLIPQTAHIAGLSFNEFSQLMAIFNTINTSFLHYTTCYGGGYNRVFMNQVLQTLQVKFITVSEGYNESPTYSSIPLFTADQADTVKLSHTRFTNFFGLLNSFFGESLSFGATSIKKQLKTDPIATILSNFMGEDRMIENQPFVRIPSVGVFQALSVDKKVKILTHSLVKAYEFENRIIDLSDENIQAVLIYPQKIMVPIKTKSLKFISPTSSSLSQQNNIHIFESIIADSWLNMIFTNFILLNKSYTKTTFVIKQLQCFNSKSLMDAHLTTSQQHVINLENVIIHITSDTIEGTHTFQTSVKAAFWLNEKDYFFETSFKNDGFQIGQLFDVFDAIPSHPVSSEFLQSLADTMSPITSLDEAVKNLEQLIDTSTSVQKVGSLNKIFILKKLDILEQSTTAHSVGEQIKWLRKKSKPLTIINNRFKKHMQELDALRKQINILIDSQRLSEQEKKAAFKKIATIEKNISNVDQVIKEKQSEGYLSRITETIKSFGYDIYQRLFKK